MKKINQIREPNVAKGMRIHSFPTNVVDGTGVEPVTRSSGIAAGMLRAPKSVTPPPSPPLMTAAPTSGVNPVFADAPNEDLKQPQPTTSNEPKAKPDGTPPQKPCACEEPRTNWLLIFLVAAGAYYVAKQ